MKTRNSENLNAKVGDSAAILVVTDIPCDEIYLEDMVMTAPEMEVFVREAKACGFQKEDFAFVNPCPPLPEGAEGSDSKVAKHLAEFHDEFSGHVSKIARKHGISMVLTLGKWAARQFLGTPVQITKIRGTATESHLPDKTPATLLPLLSTRDVLRFPDRRDIFNTDFLQVASLSEFGWDVSKFREAASGSGYDWCFDLHELQTEPPSCIALDCETVGLKHRHEGFRVLTVAITRKKGESLVVPLDIEWWNNEALMSPHTKKQQRLTPKLRTKLIRQLRSLLSNPKVCVVGHNLKFDLHVLKTLGIEVANWYADTIQLAFVVDENMQSKSLNDCVRRWLPQFAGYADEFDSETDKSRMDKVAHDDMLLYAGGDTETTYRLASVLLKEAKKDTRNWNTFTRIQMPALRLFFKMERRGIRLNVQALRDLRHSLAEREEELRSSMVAKCPPKLLRRCAEEGKAVSFNSPDFLAELLFGEEGIRVDDDGRVSKKGRRLKPCVFTKGGKISTSAKDHLPYFEEVDLVQELIEYKQVEKMRSTYVGAEASVEVGEVKRLKDGSAPSALRAVFEERGIDPGKVIGRRRTPLPSMAEKGIEELRLNAGSKGNVVMDAFGNMRTEKVVEPTGFWQYIEDTENPVIHPSFWLHRTVTGRTSSSEPNAQNIPKRGHLAKAFRKIFVPTSGFSLVEADLSQAEIRVAACMAGEREMIRIYSEDGDIHSATAAATMHLEEGRFMLGINDETPLIEVANRWPGSDSYLKKLDSSVRRTVTVSDFCDFKRFCAKAVNFGFLYGMGWRKFKVYARTDYKIEYTDEEAQEARNAFFRKYPRLEGWHEAMREFLKEHGYVRAIHGALRRLPNIGSDDDLIIGMTSRQGINSPVQRFASDLGISAAILFARDAPEELMRILMFIHDANIAEGREDVIEEVGSALRWYMQNVPLRNWFNLDLPVKFLSDVAIGPNLAEMQKRPDIEAVKPAWHGCGLSAPPDAAESLAEQWQTLIDYGVIPTDV